MSFVFIVFYSFVVFFFFNDTATTEIYTLSLHDALPIETAAAPADMFRATEGRWGSREIEITDVMLSSADGERSHVFHSGDRVDIRIRMRAPLPIDDFVIGIGLFNAEGVCCYGTNTSLEEYRAEQIAGDAEAILTITSLDLVEG